MKLTYSLLLLSIFLIGCSKKSEPQIVLEEELSTPITTELRTFIFGHSLINHELNINPVPSQETSVPHWMHLMAQAGGYDYAASGQYGFLPQHANLPPISQWGFDLFPGIWDSDTQPFGDANFNTILITAGNFIQWQSSLENYYQEDISPIDATLDIADWVTEQEEGITIYIYENWPDMAGYMESFPPTEAEFNNYHEYTTGDFHDWWLEYHDVLMEERPSLNIRMIPVGPILTKLLTETPLSEVPIDVLYEDDAPHGRPTIYFLSGMITYMAMFGIETPENYRAPAIVHESVNENYDQIVSIIWEELEAFNDDTGESRVW
jgi:hypothetical protein